MLQNLNKKLDPLLYYQCILAVGAVFIFFTDVTLYFFSAGVDFRPVTLIYVFGIASTPLLFLSASRTKYLSLPLTIWCAGYISVSLISFLLFFSSEVAYQELQHRVLSVLFLFSMMLIFSQHYVVQIWARRAVFIAVLIAVLNNILELLNPLVFSALNQTGRPAGFYIDPNRTGCALMLGMIFSVGLLQPRYRVHFISVIGFGILLTFSRGAILSWLVITLIFLKNRVITRSQLLYWAIGIGVIIFLLGISWLNTVDLDKIQNFGISQRIEWLQNPSFSEDSADFRLQLAKLGWQLFTEHPFFGNGIGSTLELSVGKSTHNMYLYFMADHGILGAFILPLLVYAVTRHARGESKCVGLSFATFILIWGLFSHTVLEDRFILMMFSLMAVMTVSSQLNLRSQAEHKL